VPSFANRDRWLIVGIGLLASAIAVASARPYAGSWNDGSRLATAESLVDRGTLAIDRSIFVDVPRLNPDRPSPYSPHDKLLQQSGTKDKLFIDGRYYSDKSPVPAYYLAGIYRAGRALGMPSAADRPDWFCLLMTLASSGLAYVVAVMCLFSIARRIGLDCLWSAGVTFFFMAGTVALPYAQYVNNHILLLAVALVIFQLLLTSDAVGWTWRRMIALGTCAGIAYTIDLGAGPPLCALVIALSRKRLLLIVAASPWIAFHHIANYQIGGSLAPANANPVFFNWPGSPFGEQNMTGGWNHANPLEAALYALAMLFGKKGFLGHNLILFVPLVGLALLLRRRHPEYRTVSIGLIWAVGTWLLYAATSNNSSGGCCSVRWFVPLLAPGFVALCVLLRDHPAFRIDALIAGSGGILLGIGMTIRGPWFHKLMPFYFVIYFGTLIVWMAARWLMRMQPIAEPQIVTILSVRIAEPTRFGAHSDTLRPNPDPVAANNR
jgi:hypothetical protein